MKAKIIQSSAIAKCPWMIFSAAHYDDEGNCRCTDPTHKEMIEWGYTWNEEKGRWTANEAHTG